MQQTRYIFFLLFTFFACNDSTKQINSLKAEVVRDYAQIAYLNYQDAHQSALELKQAIDAFVASPSDVLFQKAKQAWLAARAIYSQTEVFRFYGSPIDNPQHNLEPHINAWPLDESYIDYVEGNLSSGIINDLSIHLDKATLRAKNEQDGVEENVSIGYHAIEFLLWGQDLYKEGAGKRSFTDYTTAPNADRRKKYLQLCVEVLIEDLAEVTKAWNPTEQNNYRSEFVKDVETSLAKILTGMGSLSRAELGGERMRVALVNHDQEDEHSCFSDNTHNDIIANIQGMVNIYEGKYRNFQGKGLADLLTSLDKNLAEEMKENLTNSLLRAKAIQPPFDAEISHENPQGNERILKTIQALDEQTKTIEEIANLLGLSINTKGT